MKDDYEYSMTNGTDEVKEKSLKRQVELLEMDRIILIDKVLKLEERIFKVEQRLDKMRKPIQLRGNINSE